MTDTLAEADKHFLVFHLTRSAVMNLSATQEQKTKQKTNKQTNKQNRNLQCP